MFVKSLFVIDWTVNKSPWGYANKLKVIVNDVFQTTEDCAEQEESLEH